MRQQDFLVNELSQSSLGKPFVVGQVGRYQRPTTGHFRSTMQNSKVVEYDHLIRLQIDPVAVVRMSQDGGKFVQGIIETEHVTPTQMGQVELVITVVAYLEVGLVNFVELDHS